MIRNCRCERADRACSYHFFTFLQEQGLTKEDARDVTAFEGGVSAEEIASLRLGAAPRTTSPVSLAQMPPRLR